MASAPQQSLPLFYNELQPLSSQQHADFKIRAADKAPFLAKQHAVPSPSRNSRWCSASCRSSSRRARSRCRWR